MTGYAVATVAPTAVAPLQVRAILVSKGFRVLSPEAAARLHEEEVPDGAVMVVSCYYLGHSPSDALGSTAAEVSCEGVDWSNRAAIYSGKGRYTGMTIDGDMAGAVRNALADLPGRGTQGSVTMVSGFAPRSSSAPRLSSVQSGSGFVVAESLIVTNAHVVAGCSSVTSSAGPLSIVRVDGRNDLALLRGSFRLAPLTIRNSLSASSGESVIAIGYPLSGLLASEPIVSTGIVSATAGLRDNSRYLQISAPVQPGNSGGPLLDESGLIIGVVVAKLNAAAVFEITGDIPQNVNFAIAPTTLRGFLESAGARYAAAERRPSRRVEDIVSASRSATVHLQCSR
jgi:S1-C subfamily serine protease